MIKKVIIILLIIIVGLSIYFAVVFSRMDEKLSAIEISDFNLEDVSDGLYRGEAKTELISAVVEVEIEDKKNKSIKILDHKNWRGDPAEVIVDRVIEKQSLKVNVISKATVSSKIILPLRYLVWVFPY